MSASEGRTRVRACPVINLTATLINLVRCGFSTALRFQSGGISPEFRLTWLILHKAVWQLTLNPVTLFTVCLVSVLRPLWRFNSQSCGIYIISRLAESLKFSLQIETWKSLIILQYKSSALVLNLFTYTKHGNVVKLFHPFRYISELVNLKQGFR